MVRQQSNQNIFNTGFMVLIFQQISKKFAQLPRDEQIEEVLAFGKQIRERRFELSKILLESSKVIQWTLNGETYSVRIVFVSDYQKEKRPIIETCELLVQNSPSVIGMLVRYDTKVDRTLVSCRITPSSDLSSAKLMKQLVGGGLVAGLKSIEEIFSILTEKFILS